MWQSLAGAGVFVIKDDLVLMILCEQLGKIRWALPSGLTEQGESLEATAARVTLATTGVPVAIKQLLCTAVVDLPNYSYRNITAYFYATQPKDVTPTPPVGVFTPTSAVGVSKHILAAEYCDPLTIIPQTLHPADRRILNLWKRQPNRPPFHIHLSL